MYFKIDSILVNVGVSNPTGIYSYPVSFGATYTLR